MLGLKRILFPLDNVIHGDVTKQAAGSQRRRRTPFIAGDSLAKIPELIQDHGKSRRPKRQRELMANKKLDTGVRKPLHYSMDSLALLGAIGSGQGRSVQKNCVKGNSKTKRAGNKQLTSRIQGGEDGSKNYNDTRVKEVEMGSAHACVKENTIPSRNRLVSERLSSHDPSNRQVSWDLSGLGGMFGVFKPSKNARKRPRSSARAHDAVAPSSSQQEASDQGTGFRPHKRIRKGNTNAILCADPQSNVGLAHTSIASNSSIGEVQLAAIVSGKPPSDCSHSVSSSNKSRKMKRKGKTAAKSVVSSKNVKKNQLSGEVMEATLNNSASSSTRRQPNRDITTRGRREPVQKKNALLQKDKRQQHVRRSSRINKNSEDSSLSDSSASGSTRHSTGASGKPNSCLRTTKEGHQGSSSRTLANANTRVSAINFSTSKSKLTLTEQTLATAEESGFSTNDEFSTEEPLKASRLRRSKRLSGQPTLRSPETTPTRTSARMIRKKEAHLRDTTRALGNRESNKPCTKTVIQETTPESLLQNSSNASPKNAKNGLESMPWTNAENALLREAHREVDAKSRSFWQDIAERVKSRSARECREKWYKLVTTPAAQRRKKERASNEAGLSAADDIFDATPMRFQNHILDFSTLDTSDIGSSIKVQQDCICLEEEASSVLLPSAYGYKTYLKNVKRDVKKAEKMRAPKVPLASNVLRTKTLNMKDSVLGVEIKGRLSLSGNLHVDLNDCESDQESILEH